MQPSGKPHFFSPAFQVKSAEVIVNMCRRVQKLHAEIRVPNNRYLCEKIRSISYCFSANDDNQIQCSFSMYDEI